MKSGTMTDADDLDDEAARPPTRRDGRIIAVPNAPIPPELNAEFLADLAFERALSAARNLAISSIVFTEPPVGGLQAARGRNDPSELAAGAGGHP
jgi:hypothetical protein